MKDGLTLNIRGAITATLTMVGVDKITTKRPLKWGFNGWMFYFIFTQCLFFLIE
jgi:hypothetical protein